MPGVIIHHMKKREKRIWRLEITLWSWGKNIIGIYTEINSRVDRVLRPRIFDTHKLCLDIDKYHIELYKLSEGEMSTWYHQPIWYRTLKRKK